MQHHKKRWLAIILLASLGLCSSASGQGGLSLNRSIVAGGGGTLHSGSFSLTGVIGQPYAGEPLHSGSFSLTGGAWVAPRSSPAISRSSTALVNSPA